MDHWLVPLARSPAHFLHPLKDSRCQVTSSRAYPRGAEAPRRVGDKSRQGLVQYRTRRVSIFKRRHMGESVLAEHVRGPRRSVLRWVWASRLNLTLTVQATLVLSA